MNHHYCWAHTRYKFEHTLDNDRERAMILQHYAIEPQVRQQGLSFVQRNELNLNKLLPILMELGQWIASENKKV